MRPVIVGGGPAGAAAAIMLGRAGAEPLVLERSHGPHDTVCGDFLSGEAGAALDRLGVDLAGLGAVPVRWVRLVHGERSATAPLPFPAWGLSRRMLDEALLRRAAACGAEVVRGETVRAVTDDGAVVRAGGGRIAASSVFVATGKHDLRGCARPRVRRMVGFKMYVQLAPEQAEALGGGVEIVLLAGGYAGLQQVEDGRAVLCWLTRGGDAAACLRHPWIARRLRGAVVLTERPFSVAGMPYGFVAEPGRWFRLGDQGAVIPSFAGAGVAIALLSGVGAAGCLLHGDDPAVFQRLCARWARGPVRRAVMLHRLLSSSGWGGSAVGACRAWPGVMAVAARLTRVEGFCR